MGPIKHIGESTEQTTSLVYDPAKRQDAWYNDDWQFDILKSDPKCGRQGRKVLGFNYVLEDHTRRDHLNPMACLPVLAFRLCTNGSSVLATIP